ncbi:DUF2975 domain-containing protein [Epilithonimonas ginsengisoli]|uniref:DUF2975 domain-containing protein n=1 Tax=Epilithonimonas ginsengisoli TaxID=1245592 RepID=A0ABU4JDA0_9FLAO|nr:MULTISPECIES: DUF2975 domain-containing protein [Chryseobacterium group]MBV6878624.1 DUF2975 domain-containing protein [Epilithonimonas sp. FP105]MDW8547649.1 DUF2975 domain-containing protein [Epilithonimonas ginsengisoli]OAH75239.1 hypothetical protein AXA65_04535 [Chryseobacterium sp. FP211-J200]
MNTKTILSILNVIAWIAFVGLCIETGAFIVGGLWGVFSDFSSEGRLMVMKYDFMDLLIKNRNYFICLWSLIVFLLGYKAYLFFVVINVFKKLDLENPFSKEVSDLILRISYVSFGIWIIWVITDQFIEGLLKKGFDISSVKYNLGSDGGFIFLAGIIYIIAQIFKRGIELQNENDLTI